MAQGSSCAQHHFPATGGVCQASRARAGKTRSGFTRPVRHAFGCVTKSELVAAMKVEEAAAEEKGSTVLEARNTAYWRQRVLLLDDVVQVATSTDEETELVGATEAAKRLGHSRRWMYDHADDFPFTVRFPDGGVRFSRTGIAEFLEQRS